MPKKELPQLKRGPMQERLSVDGMTQEEVADVMQLSRAQIISIEKKALRKLKYIITRKFRKEDLL